MEFLKNLFANGPLTYDQLAEAVSKAGMNVVDLSSGAYVAKDKFDNRVNTLTQQITDLNGQLSQRDTDLNGLNEQLTAAKNDAAKMADVQTQLTALQGKYTKDTEDYQKKLTAQAYDFALREASSGLHFSSNSAKRAFLEDASAKGLKLDGGKLLGWDDYVTAYRTADPGAFKTEAPADEGGNGGPGGNPPAIVLPAGSGKTAGAEGGKSLFNFNFAGVRPNPAEK